MTELTKQEIRDVVAKAFEPITARVDRLAKAAEAEEARRQAVHKRQVEDLARQVVAAHDQLVEKELAAGVRTVRPVHKAGATLAERLQEIAGEAAIAKRNRDMWKGTL